MEYKKEFQPGDVLLGLKLVLKIVGISKAQIYRLVADGVFPRPLKIGKHRVAWVEAEVHAYLTARIQQRNQKYVSGEVT